MTEPAPTIPWSSRAPQKYVLALVAIVVAVALVITAIAYIAAGTGGIVPFLMLVGAPTLGIVYVYVFAFKKWDAA